MNSLLSKIISFISAVILALTGTSSISFNNKSEDFRLTAYIVGNGLVNYENIDTSHFSQLTDIILFGVAYFNTQGEVILNDNFDLIYNNLKNAMSDSNANVHLNIIGPGSSVSTDNYEERMNSQASNHNLAFRSGNLEQSIYNVLEKYGFDGIYFDYEYPIEKSDWEVFGDFIISLDEKLGDKYKIGCAISSWNCLMPKNAIKHIDYAEIMAYDIWDSKGNHASLNDSKKFIRKAYMLGFSKKQMSLGIPFYGRPTTQEAYWYGYNGSVDKLDENGLAYDEDTGLTFSFNNYDTVYNKTKWAINYGLGGVMAWHYACDVPADKENSLFNAMYNAKQKSVNNIFGFAC